MVSCLVCTSMTLPTAKILSNVLDSTVTRDLIVRGVSVATQIELLATVRDRLRTFEPIIRSATWMFGEDADDVVGAGELGYDVDHSSVVTLQHTLPGCDSVVVRRAYATPLALFTAHEAEEINLIGFDGLGFDVVCMAARLADPTYAPRLRKLIINGEPNEALLARAHERMLTVEAWHEGCVDTQPVFAG